MPYELKITGSAFREEAGDDLRHIAGMIDEGFTSGEVTGGWWNLDGDERPYTPPQYWVGDQLVLDTGEEGVVTEVHEDEENGMHRYDMEMDQTATHKAVYPKFGVREDDVEEVRSDVFEAGQIVVFTSSASDAPKKKGKVVPRTAKVLRQLGRDQVDYENGRMYEIEYTDGSGTWEAFAEELELAS